MNYVQKWGKNGDEKHTRGITSHTAHTGKHKFAAMSLLWLHTRNPMPAGVEWFD
jgi:hypothetical protein